MPTTSPPPGWHPEEYELADLLDGSEPSSELVGTGELDVVREHVGRCPVCQTVLARAGAVPRRVDPRVGRATLTMDPSVLMSLVSTRTSTPAAGQVWRLRAPDVSGAGEMAELVTVLRVEHDVLVAPATSDLPGGGDLWTQHLQLHGTPVWLGVWVSLAAPVGLEFLEALVAAVDPAPLTDAWRRLRLGETPASQGLRARAVDQELRDYREQLRARLTSFAQARLLPQNEGAEGIDIRAALTQVAWTPSQLGRVAGITPGHARQVLGGNADLTPGQIQAVGAELGVEVIAGRSGIPGAKVRAIAAPTRRHRFAAVAARRGTDAWEYRAAQCHYTAAARASRGTDADWDELVEQHLLRLESQTPDGSP